MANQWHARKGAAEQDGAPGGWVAQIKSAFASVLLPADCRICERLLVRASRIPICEECIASFKEVLGRICEVCGAPLFALSNEESDAALCPACQSRTYSFERARSYGVYEGALTKAILLLKFERMEPLGAYFAEKLVGLAREGGEAFGADLVVPVPLHAGRRRERGYNQAELIARPLAKKLRIPFVPMLVRIRPRPDKRVLSLEERWESVRGAFATRTGSQVDKRRVLLLDDVLTTGATLDACARVLGQAGAKSVVGLTVARAVRYPVRGSGNG